jgi:hypothetical protein
VPKREKIYIESITIRVTESEKKRLKEACEKKGYSNISVCLREIIDSFIKSVK